MKRSRGSPIFLAFCLTVTACGLSRVQELNKPSTQDGIGNITVTTPTQAPPTGSSSQTAPGQTPSDNSTAQVGSFPISGKVTGLSGTLVLQNNRGNDLTINADGIFEFSEPVKQGDSYAVTIKTQPQEQTCVLYQNTGSQVKDKVTSIIVNCREFWRLPYHHPSFNSIADSVVNDVFVSEGVVYAATQDGLSISKDGGVTWVNKNGTHGLGSDFVYRIFASGNTVYAATTAGLSISNDGGVAWVTKTSANGLGSNTVYRIFASGNTVYAATPAGLSISNDGGVTWANKTMTNGLGSDFVNGVFASGNTVYAATTAGLSISNDGGVTWTNKTTSNGLGTNYLDVFASGSKIYAAIRFSDPATNALIGGVSISTDSGATWVNKITTTNVVFKIFISGNTIYAATGGGLLISHDGGVTWVSKIATNGLGSDFVSGVSASGLTIHASTRNGLSISRDGGVTWTNKIPVNILGVSRAFRSISGAGNNIYAGSLGEGIFISTDSGTSWKLSTTANGLGSNFTSELFVSEGKIYAATSSGLSISSDGGMTWENKSSKDGLGSLSVSGVFASGRTIYAATRPVQIVSHGTVVGGGLSMSNDGGATWVTKTTANGLASNEVMGVFASGRTIYAATRAFISNDGTLVDGGLSISNDGGATWVTKTTANGLGSNSVHQVYASGSTLYAATTGGLSISKDGGETWVTKTTANGLGSNRVKVYASGSTLYAATEGGLSISKDGGATWVNKTFTDDGLVSNGVNDVFVSGDTVYAASFRGISVKKPKIPVR